MPKIKPLTLGIIIATFGLPSLSYAEHSNSSLSLETVTVSGERLDELLNQSGQLNKHEIQARQSSVSDTAKLLEGMPGVSTYGAGGVSSLPAIHGLADDRLRIKVDGMDLISACANHMNPPLSYINPSNIDTIALYAGLSPVSMGGDSIGGSIVVESTQPQFAQGPDDILTKGELGSYYRSNGDARGGNISATIASQHLSINYNGSTSKANNYDAGGNFKAAGLAASDRGYLAGNEVGSSKYETTNHALNIALHHENHLLQLKLAHQNIPYQGWPNQRMDMVENRSNQVNFSYDGDYSWGNLAANLYREKTHHKMQFGDDKQLLYGVDAVGMPMETEGDNIGFSLQTELITSERDLIRLGTDIQNYTLDDFWEASGSAGMMAPNTFLNINNGQRDRYGVFAEWEANWNPRWETLAGIRYEHVKMNADDIQGYNPTAIYSADASAFNSQNREKNDDNIDLTLLAKFTPSKTLTYEFGYAQKTRSPNLYERYSWAKNGMAMRMVNLAGDGNGYVGNLDLEPEVAHTISATVNLHDAEQQNWNMTLTPYLSYVDDFIDASRCSVNGVMMSGCTAGNQTLSDGFVYLQYQNQSARLYGIDLSGYKVFKTADMGTFTTKANINYVRGKNRETGDDLYNIMPLNAKFAVEQRQNRWKNTVEWEIVSAKDDTNAERNEIETSGYGLIHLRTSYELKQARFDFGVENVFDRLYSAPLGGAYVGQGQTMGTNVPWGVTVPGVGRSIYAGMTLKF